MTPHQLLQQQVRQIEDYFAALPTQPARPRTARDDRLADIIHRVCEATEDDDPEEVADALWDEMKQWLVERMPEGVRDKIARDAVCAAREDREHYDELRRSQR